MKCCDTSWVQGHVAFTYLLMPVYSLGAWAIDQSSPPDPALRHGCNFLPGVPHLPRFRLHISPPGVSWPSSCPLSLGIPCQCLSCDACLVMLAFVAPVLCSTGTFVSSTTTCGSFRNQMVYPIISDLIWHAAVHMLHMSTSTADNLVCCVPMTYTRVTCLRS